MKKQERLANKKRKTVALANIIKVNENDKESKRARDNESSDESENKIVAKTSSDQVSFLKDCHFQT
jgi:hypothetical protein